MVTCYCVCMCVTMCMCLPSVCMRVGVYLCMCVTMCTHTVCVCPSVLVCLSACALDCVCERVCVCVGVCASESVCMFLSVLPVEVSSFIRSPLEHWSLAAGLWVGWRRDVGCVGVERTVRVWYDPYLEKLAL